MQKILLLEDDATMKSLLKTLLELEGFKAFYPTELTEQAILETISSVQPDVLLTDVLMNGINGLEFIKKLPADRPFRILMTSGMDVAIECQEAGADGFILKPFMPEDLIRRIRDFSAEN
ncbi:response regulator containing CheY-like receiver, AAA-type ATPase, and DNA-binding domains [Longilinea arvoryzae]|uniref:Response regulator containing CheY-like receiver, AAA-type ATPase, and DNA-binding domains n=1 Tax=Longilinea arvoryzae TaxID=360412 RepID=A0A0S7BM10_9CHLR|nr:response regulator [Longilinea arvoryzae]GAP14730.1 response regulator containing CheY-like receiver, AAA-type ATPase, and DNA-binding domains [Longilinea arvoryzae]